MRHLNEEDVRGLLDMDTAIERVHAALVARALGRAVDVPRERVRVPQGIQHLLQGGAPEIGVVGYKVYYARPGAVRYHVHLFDVATGDYLAIVEASHLGMVRTGAASGVATRVLARADSRTVGQIGAGKQGVGQLEAVCAVRPIERACVYARTREPLVAWCEEMSARLGIPVEPADSAAAAVRGADVVNVITRSATPVLEGTWLEPGQHVNAAGANALSRRELDLAAAKRCDLLAVDARGTARKECGDLLPLVEAGLADWDTLPEIGEIAAGLRPGRTRDDQVTLFESHGMALQDLYVARAVLDRALAAGVGRDLPI